MKICTGCGHFDNVPLGLNAEGNEYLACCPDSDYVDITLPELRLKLKEVNKQLDKLLSVGSNDESIVDEKRELQQQIRNFKNNKK
jgi:hypothetical protein